MRPETDFKNRSKECLSRARSNLIRAQEPKPEGVFWDDLCFDLQQAVEKAIKSVLVMNDIEFPRTHHIELLISIVKEKGIFWPESLDEAAGLTIYAVQARYPGVSMKITEEHYQVAVKIAKKVYRWADESSSG